MNNTGSATCSLRGYPAVKLVDRKGQPIKPRVVRNHLLKTETVELRHGQRAFFTLIYAIVGPCLPHSFRDYGLAVVPPGDIRRLVLNHPLAVCDAVLGGNPTTSVIRARLGNV